MPRGHPKPVEKVCPICGKPYIDCSPNRIKITCDLKCRRIYRAKTNPEKAFNRKVYLRLNILKYQLVSLSKKDILEIRKKLKLGICDICGKKFSLSDLDIDHCHKKSKYRGILCEHCNRMLGLVYDDVHILQSAINYLNKFNS